MNKQFVIILVITFLVGMAWLIFDIVFNTKPSIPLSPKLETLLEPVNPNFNARTLEIIDQETLDRSEVPVESVPVTAATVEPSPEILDLDNESSSGADLNL